MFWKKAKPEVICKKLMSLDFDIEGLNVFSIERDYRRDVTVIGLIIPRREDPVVRWVLITSEQQHEDLVDRFRRKIGIRNQYRGIDALLK